MPPPDDRIRVLVDGIGLVRDSAYRGVGTYARHVVSGLAARSDLDVVVLVPRGTTPDVDVRLRRTVRLAPGRWAAAEHDWLLPLELRMTRGAVVFNPGLFPPRRSPYPVVQTVHDVYPLTTAAGSGDRRSWERSLPRWPKAAGVIAISAATAADAVEVLGVASERLTIAPHGADPRFRPAPADPFAAPYVLMVAEWDPRKRHDQAFEVIAGLAAAHPHVLRVAGRIAPWHEAQLRDVVARSSRPDRIELLGYVANDELVTLYQQAAALVVTSSHEGFGFPALEAMGCGVPVVAYANSATAELLDGVGVLVPDGDVAAMTAALAGLLDDPEHATALGRLGVERASHYTWSTSVERHATALRRAAGRP